MEFWKMNGAGNDFIIFNDLSQCIPNEKLADLARTVCERHLSVGADGMMVVRPAQRDGDYRMLFYNVDGSEAEMCGNGARCICRYGYENGLADEVQRVETQSGTVVGTRVDQRLYRVRLNDPSVMVLDCPVTVDGIEYPCAYVELGVPGLPHAAVPYADLARADADSLRLLGRKLRYHPAFPKGANVNFYEIIGPDHIYERTYERGVEDFTYACGTGTGSVVSVLTMQGKVSGRNVQADMWGGSLIIDVTRAGGSITDIYLTGPTNIVCKGELTDEELHLD